MRREKIYKASTRVIEKEMQGFVKARFFRDHFAQDPAETTDKLSVTYGVNDLTS